MVKIQTNKKGTEATVLGSKFFWFGMCVSGDGCSIFCVAGVPCEPWTFGWAHPSSLASPSAWSSSRVMQLAIGSV
jgi:hypothetical protein